MFHNEAPRTYGGQPLAVQVRPLERQLLLVILIIILIFGFYVPETRKIKRMITIKIMNFVMPQADLPQAENSYTFKLGR